MSMSKSEIGFKPEREFKGAIENITTQFFDNQLEKLNLNEKQITFQSLPELKESLSRINDAIVHPESFGELALKASAKTGLVIATYSSDYIFKIGILPLLLERKKLILKKINELSSEEKLDAIQDLAEKVDNDNIRTELVDEIRILREEAAKYKQEIQNITTRETEAQIKLEQQRLDGLERKSKVWQWYFQLFLQRESAASLIGSVVLLLLTFSLIIGMVFGWESQVLSNGFLVILGYFFGQSSSRNKDNDAGGNM